MNERFWKAGLFNGMLIGWVLGTALWLAFTWGKGFDTAKYIGTGGDFVLMIASLRATRKLRAYR